MHDETAMVAAHKEGREYARNPENILEMALGFAFEQFTSDDNRDAFVGGFIGERQRMLSARQPKPEPMSAATAFQIVLDLARGNIPDETNHPAESARYAKACDIIEDIAVNEYGDDN